jgi:hypothetical protein
MTYIEDIAGIESPAEREEWIREVHGRSMIVEKGIYEIRRMERLRGQNEDRVNSRKVEARIREGRGRWVIGSRNVEGCQRRPKMYRRRSRKVVKTG